jgi:HPt (histidine-containing phosphotransfer) domain-containing protein
MGPKEKNTPSPATTSPAMMVVASAEPNVTEPSISEPIAVESIAQQTQVQARIREISGNDDEFYNELIETFLSSSNDILLEMRTAIAKDDLPALAAAAHKLKGASSNLHLHKLSAIAQTIELNAKAGANRNWGREVDGAAYELTAINTFLLGAAEPIVKQRSA